MDLMSMNDVRMFSKSSVEQDWRCPRAYYWGYGYQGVGIHNTYTHLELVLGQAVHDGLAAIAHGIDIDSVGDAARQQMLDSLLAETAGEIQEVDFANEQAALVEGLLRGFYRAVWPNLMKEYPYVVAVEEPCLYQYEGLAFMAKPDLILADAEGNWVYLEYKTTSSKKQEWVNSWNTAIQLHSGIKAVEQTLGQAPASVILVGLYKGYNSYGKQNSPFCYAYKRAGNPPFSVDEVRYDYKPGFKRSPTWELPGGVAEWVAGMPEAVLAEQFLQTPPIFVKDELIDNFFTQQKWRQREIELAEGMVGFAEDDEARMNILNVAFPQRFSECSPAWGHGCQFTRLCHGPQVDPLTAGYELRTDEHRQPFIKLLEQADAQ